MVNLGVKLMGILFFFTNCGADCICEQMTSFYYLDAAFDIINKAKHHLPPRGNCGSSLCRNTLDCSELLESGHKKNGVYTVWPQSRIVGEKPLEVYCDMETEGGGWTLIQKRGDFGKPDDYFYKDWKSYKEGFGDIDKDFWLGNDNIFALTNQKLYSVRFNLRTTNSETAYAHYDNFWIDDEYSKYTLHISDYKGDAGDSMYFHHNQKFSTKGEDNDNYKEGDCAKVYKGGWWYNHCHIANFNGLYPKGIIWDKWIKKNGSLQATEIKIRPRNFKLPQDCTSETPM